MMMMELEVTVLSLEEGLHSSSSSFLTSLFSSRITPFITLTKIPPPSNGDKPCHVYMISESPSSSWDHHKFFVPLDSTFFSDNRYYSSLHLQVWSKRRVLGPAQLGWCLIPASDIGLIPSGSLRYLSYRLRSKDGSKSDGIINLAVRLGISSTAVEGDACQTVIGMPVTAVRGNNGDCEMKSGRWL